MGDSWGHTIRPLTTEEIEREAQMREKYGERYYSCRTPRCVERSAFQTTYQYVTGRAGRVSYARKNLCSAHAEKLRAKYEPVEIPAEQRPQHTAQAAFEQIRGAV